MSPSDPSPANDRSFNTAFHTAPVYPVVYPGTTANPPAAGPKRSPYKSPAVDAPGRTTVWNVPFDLVTLRQSIDHIEELIRSGEPSYVITANLNYVMLHHQQADLRVVTDQAALIVADGQPIVLRSKLNAESLPGRVAGSEMIFDLAQRASERGWGIYLLGGEQGVAQACAQRLAEIYPGLRIAGVESPPFRALTAEEQAAQDQRIQASQAQILLVAFGQPKGERWIHQNYKRLGVPVSIQLGASFDFVAGTAHRAPLLWQRLGLEWAYRMCSDPMRLVPRYAANAAFLANALVRDWVGLVNRWGFGI